MRSEQALGKLGLIRVARLDFSAKLSSKVGILEQLTLAAA
jgi:hypothetical protein